MRASTSGLALECGRLTTMHIGAPQSIAVAARGRMPSDRRVTAWTTVARSTAVMSWHRKTIALIEAAAPVLPDEVVCHRYALNSKKEPVGCPMSP